jgi:hypothetical protein
MALPMHISERALETFSNRKIVDYELRALSDGGSSCAILKTVSERSSLASLMPSSSAAIFNRQDV